MSSSVIVKYGFRIRTRSGLIVDNVLIHGRDEVELRQMYRHCKTLHQAGKSLLAAGAR